MEAKPELWTPEDFARFARLSLNQVQKMRSTGTGPAFVKFGRRVRYVPGVCHRWVLENQQTTTKETQNA